MKKCIIIGNGKSPTKKVINYFYQKGFNTVICADGGANHAKRLGVIPGFIIGDLDSATPSVLKYYSGKSKIIRINRQNDTDVEKCLKFAIRKNFTEAVLLGVTGDRLDHTIGNLGIIIKFYAKIHISLVAENSILFPANTNLTIKSKINETISLFAFNNRTRITSEGLKYKLTDARLPFGERESTSNVSISKQVSIKISSGIIFIIRDFNIVRKNDLF